ncbi:hypothetical protein [Silvibacterium sp.]|uniref:hypothetical protein n=1 Tax=Silvibacterium sp. TaxID=1964179 RepID=UPI0039E4D071
MERVLGVAIGIAVVCLLLSIIASHLQEVWAWFTARRAASLVSAIESMLGGEIAHDFFQHPLIRTISFSTPKVTVALHTGKVSRKKKDDAPKAKALQPGEDDAAAAGARPTYIPAALFSRVLVAVLCEKHEMCGAPVRSLVAKIENRDLKRRLEAVLAGTEQHVSASTLALEQWYDGTMDRINGLYKQNTQTVLLYIGMALAVLCNANLFSITKDLWSSEDARTVLTTTAQMYSCKDAGGCSEQDYQQARRDLTGTLESYIPVGYHHTGAYWEHVGDVFTHEARWKIRLGILWGWVLNLAGWGLTGIAVSLGAPFWFDAVNKLVNIRLAGDKPPRTEPPAIGSVPPAPDNIVVTPKVVTSTVNAPVLKVVTPPEE